MSVDFKLHGRLPTELKKYISIFTPTGIVDLRSSKVKALSSTKGTVTILKTKLR